MKNSYQWRRFVGGLISPFMAVAFLFIAIRDGFVLQKITFRSEGREMAYLGGSAVLFGVALVLGAILCAWVAYRFYMTDKSFPTD